MVSSCGFFRSEGVYSVAIDINKEDSIVWLTDFVTPSLLSLFCNSIQSSGDGSIVVESFAWREG